MNIKEFLTWLGTACALAVALFVFTVIDIKRNVEKRVADAYEVKLSILKVRVAALELENDALKRVNRE